MIWNRRRFTRDISTRVLADYETRNQECRSCSDAVAARLPRTGGDVLEVQVGQPLPVHQHDLSLGLAEEAEDTHTVKM